jgi:HPt (histidine-containing phosphotransfer) domain-containing protein
MTVNTLRDDRENAIAIEMNHTSGTSANEESLNHSSEQWRLSAAEPVAMTVSPSAHSSLASIRLDSDALLLDSLHLDSLHLDTLRQQINWEHLHQLSDDNTEFEWELLQIFVSDSHDCLKNLEQAIATQDYWQTEQSAHHLKGASANVGANRMQNAAAQLEQHARSKQFQDSDRLINALKLSLQLLQRLITLESGLESNIPNITIAQPGLEQS